MVWRHAIGAQSIAFARGGAVRNVLQDGNSMLMSNEIAAARPANAPIVAQQHAVRVLFPESWIWTDLQIAE